MPFLVVVALLVTAAVGRPVPGLLPLLQAQAKPNITGTWAFEVSTQAGAGQATVTFRQDGEKLTGHYAGSTLGEADLTGTVSGTNAKFAFTVNVQGNALDVTYDATIESNDAMKGSLTITAIGGGTFTGKRTK